MQSVQATNQPKEAIRPADELPRGPEALWLEFSVTNPGLAKDHPLRVPTFSVLLPSTAYFGSSGYSYRPEVFSVDDATLDRKTCWLLGRVSKQDPFVLRVTLTNRAEFRREIQLTNDPNKGYSRAAVATDSMALQKSPPVHLAFGESLIHIVCAEYDLADDGEIPNTDIKTRLFCPTMVKLFPAFYLNRVVSAVTSRAFELRRSHLARIEQLNGLKRSHRNLTADVTACEESVQKAKRQRTLVGDERDALEAELAAVKGGLFDAFDEKKEKPAGKR